MTAPTPTPSLSSTTEDLCGRAATGIVWVAGAANWDTIYPLQRQLTHGGYTPSDPPTSRPGGTGLNTAAWAAHHGAEARLITIVGEDAPGAIITREAADRGVSTEWIRQRDHTWQMLVAVDDERTMIGAGPNPLRVLDCPLPEDELQPGDIVVLCDWTVSWIGAARRAAGRGVLVVGAHPTPARARAALSIGSTSDRDHDRGAAQVVITTDGGGPIAVGHAGGLDMIGVPSTAVTDPTGCGDSFRGALVASLANRVTLGEAITAGISAAQLCASQPASLPPLRRPA